MTSEIKVDTISEQTSANGVTIDGLTIKDGNIIGDVALAGTTPTFTIGDAGAEDASLIFDGNAQDFYVALDDSADDLVIGLGNTIGTTPIMSFDESKNVTIHDGTLKVESDNANALVAPLLQLDRISSSPADGDLIGAIRYTARLDNGNSAEFAGLEAKIIESSTADGEITLNIAKGGNVRSAIKANNTEVIINDASEDIDFRVESNGTANMLFVNGGTNKVGIGTDAPAELLEVEGTGAAIQIDSNGDSALRFATSGTVKHSIFSSSGVLNFFDNTNSATRMSIDATGLTTITSSTADHILNLVLGTTSTDGIDADFATTTPDDDSRYFFRGQDATAVRIRIDSNGDVTNHDNDYGQISDERIKSNITDANSQWDDIKAIKVKNFERKDDITQYGAGKKVQIGVVAQEVETVSPGLIKEGEPTANEIKMSSAFGALYEDGDDIPEGKAIGDIKSLSGEKVKKVSYSVLYMKAIKALQEAMTKIEDLQARVTTLEG